MTDSNPSRRSTSSATKTTWQPSARDMSSRSFGGSFTTRGQDPQPAGSGAPAPRRTLASLIATVVVVGIVAGWAWHRRPPVSPSQANPPAAVVDLVRGPVQWVAGANDPRNDLARGMPVAAGTVIDTTGSDSGRVALRLTEGPSVRVDDGSRVRVVSPTRLDLEAGAVYVDSDGAAASSGIEVRTTFGVVRDIGTQFEVRWIDSDTDEPPADEPDPSTKVLQVQVREGEIVVTTPDGVEHDAILGERLAVRADGVIERTAVPIYGEAWRWVLHAAAVPDVEGRPLAVFLDWLMREGGWTLHFADDDTEAKVAATSLHGTIDGLNAEEATPMVLEGSGLDFTIVDDRFTVHSASEASEAATDSNVGG